MRHVLLHLAALVLLFQVAAAEDEGLKRALERMQQAEKSGDAEAFKTARSEAMQLLTDEEPSVTGIEIRLLAARADVQGRRPGPALKSLLQAERDAQALDRQHLLGRVFLLRAKIQAGIAGDFSRGAQAFERAVEAFGRADSAAEQVPALGGQADCACELGDIELELRLRRRAIDLALKLPDRTPLAISSRNLMIALTDAKRYDEALALDDEVRKFLTGDEFGTTRSFLRFGRARALQGLRRLVEADAAYAQVLSMLEEAGAIRSAALMLLDHARDMFNERRDSDRALAATRRALVFAERLDDAFVYGRVHVDMAYYLYASGRLAEALVQYERALAAARRAKHIETETKASVELAYVYHELSRHEKCLALARSLRKRFPEDESLVLDTMLLETRSCGALRDGPAALQSAKALMEFSRGAKDILAIERSGALSAAAISLAELGLAEEAKRVAEEALSLLDPEEKRTHNGFHAMAMAALASEDLAAGETWLRRSIAQIEGTAFATTSGRRTDLARLLLRREKRKEAIEQARIAIDQINRGLRNLGESDALGGRKDARLASDILLAAVAEETSQFDAVLRAVETSRAVSLTGEVMNAEHLLAARVSPDLLAAERSARQRLENARRERAGKKAEGTEIAHAYRELEEAVARAQRDVRTAAPLLLAQPIDAPGLVAALPENTLFISYQVTRLEVPKLADRMFALVISRDVKRVVDLGPAEPIEKDVATWIRLARNPRSNDQVLARRLYQALLAPIAELVEGAQALQVSPDESLAFLPIGALLRKTQGKEKRLIETHEVAYVPSASLLALLRAPDESKVTHPRLLALGDPLSGAPAAQGEERGSSKPSRLPATQEEALAIGSYFDAKDRTLLLGRGATRAALLKALTGKPRLRALHIACHGEVNAEHPRLTGLTLADARLTLDDVYRLSIDAELVVLSACNSGRGKQARGEGVLGFVRGFLIAGSRRVVVSNWKVEDESTRKLMTSFYRRMTTSAVGHAQALREAKRELLQDEETKHPYHWAAFVLWGPGR